MTRLDEERAELERLAERRRGDHGARLSAAVAGLDAVCTACTTRDERADVRALRRAADQVLNAYVEDALRDAADGRVVAMLRRHVGHGCTEFYREGVTP